MPFNPYFWPYPPISWSYDGHWRWHSHYRNWVWDDYDSGSDSDSGSESSYCSTCYSSESSDSGWPGWGYSGGDSSRTRHGFPPPPLATHNNTTHDVSLQAILFDPYPKYIAVSDDSTRELINKDKINLKDVSTETLEAFKPSLDPIVNLGRFLQCGIQGKPKVSKVRGDEVINSHDPEYDVNTKDPDLWWCEYHDHATREEKEEYQEGFLDNINGQNPKTCAAARVPKLKKGMRKAKS
ncbi:hypothetical protein BKA67DRAFT_648488 [Truncatella angustata]|uniref:Uncharacterized protein n=1 Tax=Truncatella angustata TaxID=152316 RepID=A0A9P8UEL9_9PEZI|nr:uncharacterized protein BKA67DRAFT_648488 [Truncatella angustata]KAH6648453.1 hypothetical protein BKA67DRAFT_648488 [Truncatella angustata]